MRKTISWTLVLLWMVIIFAMSSQAADQSSHLSNGITEIVVKTVKIIVPNKDIDNESLNHVVRKCAHFFEYLILGLMMINALRSSGICGYRVVILALLICVLYAASDEVHQMFVPGRGPGVLDVIIDSSGAAVGIGAYFGFGRAARGHKKHHKNYV